MNPDARTSGETAAKPGPEAPLKTLRIIHRTVYHYQPPATGNGNDVRMRAANTPWQRCDFYLLRVNPPARMRHFKDLHGNHVSHFEIDEPHDRLVIEATNDVRVWRKIDLAAFPYGIPHSALPDCIHDLDCCEYLNPSRFVDPTPELWREAVDARGPSTDVYQTAYALMEHIYQTFEYKPGVTNAATLASDAARLHAGVCQDFAHVHLAMCRSMGIPARYVSGYLFDPSRSRMRGAHASHAWTEVYLPGKGWYGLDPTNRRVVDEYYIKVAVGRDYREVAPVTGSYFGGGGNGMEVAVDIREV